MKNFLKIVVIAIGFLSLVLIGSSEAGSIPTPTPRPFLNASQYNLLAEILDMHLNYFLSSDAVASTGLPLGAYREGYRGDYNYSNPTEWGYTLLAWIVASDRGLITQADAASRIENALNTMISLQNDPDQNYRKMFYPYYYVVEDPSGNDLANPYHDVNHKIPSIDNGFLYTSLLIVEGWAKQNSLTTVESKAHDISSQMDFRMFLKPSGDCFAHEINVDTGEFDEDEWNVYVDEGGAMAWIAYVSNSITLEEYKAVIDAMERAPREWNNIAVREAPFFNAMFTWGIRSLAGFPVTTWEAGLPNHYSSHSFAPTVQAHLAYGDSLGIYYPAFSDVMSQGSNGRYTPPNLYHNETNSPPIPEYVTPHALFVPFCIGPDLRPEDVNTLISKITDLKNDAAGYYHDGSDSHKPFGFEISMSPYKDDTTFKGPYQPSTKTYDRYIYETLGHSYTILSLYQGLNIHDGNPNLIHYACQLPGYFQKIEDVLGYLYQAPSNFIIVPQDYPTIQAAINAAAGGDMVFVTDGTYNESLTLNKSGITLIGEGKLSILQGSLGETTIYCENLSGAETVIADFTLKGGLYAIHCVASVDSLKIKNNDIDDNTPLALQGSTNVQFIGNEVDRIPPTGLQPGISIDGGTALIKDNYLHDRWDGAIKLYNGANVEIISNKLQNCDGWTAHPGIVVNSSTATISNNIITGGDSHSSDNGSGVYAVSNSNVYLYNNVFYSNRGKGDFSRGVALNVFNSDIAAKNNIFYANATGQETVYFSGTGTKDFSYNNMWDNTTTQDTAGVTLGSGHLTVNPLFVDTINYDLNRESPCIDAGDPDPQFNDLNGTRNDMGIHGGPHGDMTDYVLNMTEMNWYENIAPYSSTGAAACQMILNYIREGAGEPLLSQNEIYEYARSPLPFDGTDLDADQVDKALGHFDPYDYLVSNSYDTYDSRDDGNPFQGYNYGVDTYDPNTNPNAMYDYMRDICHWMAYKVTKEEWWKGGELVARPNTPAALPIYGTYDHWVVMKGCVTSINPAPAPHTTPAFIIYGFWMKDPLITGIGQNTYKTAAECESTYFQPLSTTDSYNGLYLQVAEPPAEKSLAKVTIPQPVQAMANFEFIGIDDPLREEGPEMKAMGMFSGSANNEAGASFIKRQSWRNLVDEYFLADPYAVAAFEGTVMGKAVLVNRLDLEGSGYYLVPFGQRVRGKGFLTSGVIILDSKGGYFKEASWTEEPEKFLPVTKRRALKLIRSNIIRNMRTELRNIPRRPRRNYLVQKRAIRRKYRKLLNYLPYAQVGLAWEPNSYSSSPYKPCWKVDANGYVWYVTQEGEIIYEAGLAQTLAEIENNLSAMDGFRTR